MFMPKMYLILRGLKTTHLQKTILLTNHLGHRLNRQLTWELKLSPAAQRVERIRERKEGRNWQCSCNVSLFQRL
jgi:hypothetical protein